MTVRVVYLFGDDLLASKALRGQAVSEKGRRPSLTSLSLFLIPPPTTTSSHPKPLSAVCTLISGVSLMVSTVHSVFHPELGEKAVVKLYGILG